MLDEKKEVEYYLFSDNNNPEGENFTECLKRRVITNNSTGLRQAMLAVARNCLMETEDCCVSFKLLYTKAMLRLWVGEKTACKKINEEICRKVYDIISEKNKATNNGISEVDSEEENRILEAVQKSVDLRNAIRYDDLKRSLVDEKCFNEKAFTEDVREAIAAVDGIREKIEENRTRYENWFPEYIRWLAVSELEKLNDNLKESDICNEEEKTQIRQMIDEFSENQFPSEKFSVKLEKFYLGKKGTLKGIWPNGLNGKSGEKKRKQIDLCISRIMDRKSIAEEVWNEDADQNTDLCKEIFIEIAEKLKDKDFKKSDLNKILAEKGINLSANTKNFYYKKFKTVAKNIGKSDENRQNLLRHFEDIDELKAEDSTLADAIEKYKDIQNQIRLHTDIGDLFATPVNITAYYEGYRDIYRQFSNKAFVSNTNDAEGNDYNRITYDDIIMEAYNMKPLSKYYLGCKGMNFEDSLLNKDGIHINHKDIILKAIAAYLMIQNSDKTEDETGIRMPEFVPFPIGPLLNWGNKSFDKIGNFKPELYVFDTKTKTIKKHIEKQDEELPENHERVFSKEIMVQNNGKIKVCSGVIDCFELIHESQLDDWLKNNPQRTYYDDMGFGKVLEERS